MKLQKRRLAEVIRQDSVFSLPSEVAIDPGRMTPIKLLKGVTVPGYVGLHQLLVG